jgi:hypothetical protein
MSTEETKALNRIRKMMALARDAAATEGERDNALRMAYATMAKYNLDMLEVDGAPAEDDPRGEHDQVYLGKLWARQINMSIAELFFCKYFFCAIRGSSGPNEKNRHVFVGKRSNAQAALELARYIVESTNREAAKAQRAAGEGFAFHRSFALGVAIRIRERCRALRAEALLPSAPQRAGTALVLASLYDREKQANEAFMVGMKLRPGRSGKSSALGYALDAGKAYGATVNLSPDKTKRRALST